MAKNEKFKEPKTIGLVLTALSGCVLGGCLAVSILMSTPVSRVSSNSGKKSLADLQVNYVSGVVSGTESDNLKKTVSRIENQLNGEIVLAEGDVNYYLSQFASDSSAESNVLMKSPNFKFLNEGAVLGLPVLVDPSGQNFEMTFQMHGHFGVNDSGPVFKTDKLYINSFRVPLVGGIIGSVLTKSLSQAPHPEKLVLGWKNITEAAPGAGNLTLMIGEKS
ncbi:hypothetical protein MLD52_03365 [Puniceicoccaceae bacterium K14]|nr:hypothetical protein [Puniceicoccaceae bacterium K14]